MDEEKLLEEVKEFHGAFYERLLRVAFTEIKGADLNLSKYSYLTDTLVNLALTDRPLNYYLDGTTSDDIQDRKKKSVIGFTTFLLNLHKIGVLDSVKETQLQPFPYGGYSQLNALVHSFNTFHANIEKHDIKFRREHYSSLIKERFYGANPAEFERYLTSLITNLLAAQSAAAIAVELSAAAAPTSCTTTAAPTVLVAPASATAEADPSAAPVVGASDGGDVVVMAISPDATHAAAGSSSVISPVIISAPSESAAANPPASQETQAPTAAEKSSSSWWWSWRR